MFFYHMALHLYSEHDSRSLWTISQMIAVLCIMYSSSHIIWQVNTNGWQTKVGWSKRNDATQSNTAIVKSLSWLPMSWEAKHSPKLTNRIATCGKGQWICIALQIIMTFRWRKVHTFLHNQHPLKFCLHHVMLSCYGRNRHRVAGLLQRADTSTTKLKTN